MTTKITKYICVKCGQEHLYQDLIKELVITINTIEKRYQHKCSICYTKKFKIISIVKS